MVTCKEVGKSIVPIVPIVPDRSRRSSLRVHAGACGSGFYEPPMGRDLLGGLRIRHPQRPATTRTGEGGQWQRPGRACHAPCRRRRPAAVARVSRPVLPALKRTVRADRRARTDRSGAADRSRRQSNGVHPHRDPTALWSRRTDHLVNLNPCAGASSTPAARQRHRKRREGLGTPLVTPGTQLPTRGDRVTSNESAAK